MKLDTDKIHRIMASLKMMLALHGDELAFSMVGFISQDGLVMVDVSSEFPYDPEKIRDRLADLMRDVAGCTKEEMIQMNDISVKA